MSKHKVSDILKSFTSQSTIAGLYHVFLNDETLLGKIFWLLSIVVLAFLGVFVSVQNYLDWKNEPVVTTVASTGYPVSGIPFPSVVICSQGIDMEGINAALYKSVFDYLEQMNGIKIKKTPLAAYRDVSTSRTQASCVLF
jgi:hypothetical protein